MKINVVNEIIYLRINIKELAIYGNYKLNSK